MFPNVCGVFPKRGAQCSGNPSGRAQADLGTGVLVFEVVGPTARARPYWPYGGGRASADQLKPASAGLRLHLYQRSIAGVTHRLRERPGVLSRTGTATATGLPHRRRAPRGGHAPPGPQVELGLVLRLLRLRCSPGRHRQVPQLLRQQGENSCPSISRASPENALSPRWWVTGWKVWWIPTWARRWCTVPGLHSEYPGSRTTSSMASPLDLAAGCHPPLPAPGGSPPPPARRK